MVEPISLFVWIFAVALVLIASTGKTDFRIPCFLSQLFAIGGLVCALDEVNNNGLNANVGLVIILAMFVILLYSVFMIIRVYMRGGTVKW